MLSTNDQFATNRKVMPRHHYILLLTSAQEEMTKQVEMFADDIDEALAHSCRTHLFSNVEVWEDGKNCGRRTLR
jgi:hypothetical protein